MKLLQCWSACDEPTNLLVSYLPCTQFTGLKQAGRKWHEKMTRTFLDMGFTVSKLDHSIFFRKEGNETLVVPVWTDDMIIAGSSRAVDTFKADLGMKFEITDLG